MLFRSGLAHDRVLRCDRAAIERLRRRPDRLRAEAERGALVVRERGAIRRATREDGDDRHVLTELAEVGDQAAAGERGVVRMRRDEDVAHGATPALRAW